MAKFFWLTSHNQGDVNSIEIDPSNRNAEEENLRKNALWFYDDEKEEAEQFLLEVKAIFTESLLLEVSSCRSRTLDG